MCSSGEINKNLNILWFDFFDFLVPMTAVINVALAVALAVVVLSIF